MKEIVKIWRDIFPSSFLYHIVYHVILIGTYR